MARGLATGIALEATLGLRAVRTRIVFEDLEGRPYQPEFGFLHHRNETLVRPMDALLQAHGARRLAGWTLSARAGVSLPLGRTEANPFALGDAGREHQHIQFGTGTWDPLLGIGASRRLGTTTVSLGGSARVVVAENDKGYRAGDRLSLSLGASRRVGGAGWGVSAGLDVAHETAEHWAGSHRQHEEGNLGRTDVLLAAGVSRALGDAGAVTLTARVPIHVRTEGAQLDYPVIFSLGWSRR